MKINNLVIVFSCMLGVFTPNILMSSTVFTGGGNGFTGNNANFSSPPAANDNSNANNSQNTPTPAIPTNILSAAPLASTPNFQNYGPAAIITNLATAATKFFTTYSTSPSRVDSWVVGTVGSTALTPNASGTVSKIVAGDSLIAALNSTDQTLADVWTFDGSQYFAHSLSETIVDVAVNNNNVYFASGKRFEQYNDSEGDSSVFVNSCPVVAGRVNAVVTSSCSNYIFTVNDTTNQVECWDNASGVKISSVCASSPVTRLATQDGYVFAVSIDSSNQIQVFDFTCPHNPSLVTTITAAGAVRELVVASGGCARVFATNTVNLKQVEGWKHDGCTISGFDPFIFCTEVIHIAADQDRVTVYGSDQTEDKMKSYSVYCGDEESCFAIPKSVVTYLGSTDCNDVYAVFADAPNQIQKFDRCGGHAVAFKDHACGDISKLVVSDNLIVTVSNSNIIDVFSADGCKLSSISPETVVGDFVFGDIVVNDVVVNGDHGGSIYVTMQAIVLTNNTLENLNTYILKFRPCGDAVWWYLARASEVITSLATSPNASYVFAVTDEDAIIVFDNCSGKRVGKFYANAPISQIVAFDDAKVCFVYESCPSVIHVLDLCVPCCPQTIGKICFGDRVLHMMGTSSCHDKLLVVPACNSNEVFGYDVSHLNCEGEFNTLDGFDPLTLCDGPVDFLVSSAPSNFTLYREGYLTNYRFADDGDVNLQFDLCEQITHLASTHHDAVFASFVSNTKQVHRWCAEGGTSTTFCREAHGSIAQLVATGNYVATLNDCADKVDIWKQDGHYQGQISQSDTNDVAITNRNTEEDESSEGSVYLAHENHVILYSTDADNKTLFPQVSGPVTLIASNDDQALVFTANSDNNKIEAFTADGVTVSHICASGPITQMVSKNKLVFAVNSSNPNQIQIFDFGCAHDPILLDTVTAAGPIVQIAASEDGAELYATNTTNPKDIQGWSVVEGCSCHPTAPLATYNPFTLTDTMNLLAADASVIAIFGQIA